MAAFEYLDVVSDRTSQAALRLAAMSIGETHRVELAEGAFALEQAYRSKVRSDGFFESHRKYIDVQVVFAGEECMEVLDVSRAIVRGAYDASRDLLVYEDAVGSLLRLNAGDAAVFYPEDIHLPGLSAANGPAVVRKVVIKVPADPQFLAVER